MDGYEAAARIRSKPQHAQLPLIAMTAHAVAGFRESSLGMGMNDYVTKPIDPERLFAVLAGQISRAAGPFRAARCGRHCWTRRPGGAALPGIDMPEVLARLGGNRQLLTALLDRFLLDFEDAPQRLLAAIDDGAYDQAALLVHRCAARPAICRCRNCTAPPAHWNSCCCRRAARKAATNWRPSAPRWNGCWTACRRWTACGRNGAPLGKELPLP
jgi:CheY-like chemotaxis protein